jgi:hypothetical protein
MRHSTSIRFLGSKTGCRQLVDQRRARAFLSTLLTGCLTGLLGQSALSQTPAAPVHSVLKDTAIQSSDLQSASKAKSDRTYLSLASATSGSIHSDAIGGIQLGASDEGTIVSVTPGEDRVIGQVPAGNMVSSNMNQYASPEYSQIPSSYMGGGSYSGYATQGNAMGGNPCCPQNCHSFYVGYESLFFRRKTDETFTLSTGRFLDTFDYEFGNRITLGQMLDCTDGVEFVYTGALKWGRSRIDQSSSGALNSLLTTDGGYVNSQIDTFDGAIRHIQAEQSKLQSYETNRRWFAEDVMSTLLGLRVIQLNESFLFDSVDQDFGAGSYRKSTRNYLVGAQIGSDVYRPLGQRLSIGQRTRAGVFANFNKGETALANRGSFLIFARDNDIDLAGLIQYGATARYRILPKVSAVGGYEGWVLAGVSSVSDQSYTPVTPTSGLTYDAKDTLFFHGATGGLEILW